MAIVKLDPGKKKKAAEVVAAAFFDYPMFTCYFPDPEKRARILPWYLGNVLTCALHYGEVYTTPEMSGVIFTLPPGHTKISLGEYLKNGFLLRRRRISWTRLCVASVSERKARCHAHERLEERPVRPAAPRPALESRAQA
jgi:hypothetical protein